MSTKLNAEEITCENHPDWGVFGQNGYAAAIREVAQPIADERDELRKALELIIRSCDAGYCGDQYMEVSPDIIDKGRAILAKYPKP